MQTTGPTSAACPIIITDDEIKEAIEKTILKRKQRLNAEYLVDEVSATSWLDEEYVDGMLRRLVAMQPRLENQVGVFPVFHPTEFIGFMGSINILIYYKLIKYYEIPYELDADGEPKILYTPLLARSTLKEHAEILKYDAEIASQNALEKMLREQVNIILGENEITLEKIFTLFMQHIGRSSEHQPFLGNMNHPIISFGECKQWIVPFHINNNHYTVAVIKNTSNRVLSSVRIQYFDSMGNDLAPELKDSLVNFYKNKTIPQPSAANNVLIPVQVVYECVSENTQNDSTNCSIFAILKGIDIASANAQCGTHVLEALNKDNYQVFFEQCRRWMVEQLQQQGVKVVMSKALKEKCEQHQKEFALLSEKLIPLEGVHKALQELDAIFQDVLKQKSNLAPTVPRDRTQVATPSSIEHEPAKMIKGFHRLRHQIRTTLNTFIVKPIKTDADKNHIALLNEMLIRLEAALTPLEPPIPSSFEFKSLLMQLVTPAKEWVDSLSLLEKIVSVFSIGPMGWALWWVSTLIPGSPLLSLLGGGLGLLALYEGFQLFMPQNGDINASMTAKIKGLVRNLYPLKSKPQVQPTSVLPQPLPEPQVQPTPVLPQPLPEPQVQPTPVLPQPLPESQVQPTPVLPQLQVQPTAELPQPMEQLSSLAKSAEKEDPAAGTGIDFAALKTTALVFSNKLEEEGTSAKRKAEEELPNGNGQKPLKKQTLG